MVVEDATMAAGAKMVAAGVVQWCAVPRGGRKEVRRRLWRLEGEEEN